MPHTKMEQTPHYMQITAARFLLMYTSVLLCTPYSEMKHFQGLHWYQKYVFERIWNNMKGHKTRL